MENITFTGVWAVVSGIAAGILLLAQATEKIVKAIKAARAPDIAQNERLKALEDDMKQVKQYLTNDYDRLNGLENTTRITMRAQLALLAHGIDGNNVKQMEDAKKEIEEYLINR